MGIMRETREGDGQALVESAFLRNCRGEACIAFADPSYVRSDAIVACLHDRSLHAVLHESSHLLGHLSENMWAVFADNSGILLTAARPDGSVFELMTPLEIRE